MRPTPLRVRLMTSAASVALVAALALPLAACQTTGSSDTAGTTGAIGTAAGPDLRRAVAAWGERYEKNPADAEVAYRYAEALRANEQRTQAVAVLEQATIRNPHNTTLLGAYGRALADTGSYKQALEVLKRAHTPDQPDWRILSVQGAVLDQLGRHEDARRHYSAALKIVPDEPSVLSNLGLSYALSKNLQKAEEVLRRAAAQRGVEPRVRQNLALVVGLQGRYAEAEEIARGDLSPEEATSNVAYLRQMIERERGRNERKTGSSPLKNAVGT